MAVEERKSHLIFGTTVRLDAAPLLNAMKIALVIALLAACSAAHAAPKSKAATSRKPDPIALAHEHVKDVLKDGDSAKFKGDFIGKDRAVCGLVNAKNSYGAMVVSCATSLLPTG
jgi:hypothetical protein